MPKAKAGHRLAPKIKAKLRKETRDGFGMLTEHLVVEGAADAMEFRKRALDAGCTVAMPLVDMFRGGRYGRVRDPFGHGSSIATKVGDPMPEEMEAAQRAALAQGVPGG